MAAPPGGACTVRVRRAQPEAEYTLQLDQEATLPALRTALAAASAVPPENQRLIFRGAELGHMDVALSALGVEHGSVLHLVARAQAPPPPPPPPGGAADAQGQQQQQQQQQQRGTQAGAVRGLWRSLFSPEDSSLVSLTHLTQLAPQPLAQVIIGEIFNALGQRLSPGPQVAFNAPAQQQQAPQQRPWPFPTGASPQQQQGGLPDALMPMNAVQAYAQRLRDVHVGVGHWGAHTHLVIAGDGAVPLFGGGNSDATPGPRHGGDGGAAPGVVHGNVQCDGCGTIPIRHRRFKSLTQPDYDLCAACCASGRFAAQGPFTCLEQPIPILMVADPPQQGGQGQQAAPRFPAPPTDTAARVAQLAAVLDNARDVAQTALPMLTRVAAALHIQGELAQPQQRAEAQAVALQTAALLNAQGALSLELARLLGGLSFGRSPQDMALWQRGPVVFISPDGVQPTPSVVPMPGVPQGAMGMPMQNVMAMMAQQQAQAAMQQQQQQVQQHMQQVQQQLQQHMQQQMQQQMQGLPQQGQQQAPPGGAPVPASSSFEWRINLGPVPPPDGGQPQEQMQPAVPPPPGVAVPEAVIQVGVGVLPVPGPGATQPAAGADGVAAGSTSIAVPLPLGAIVQGVLQSLSAPGATSGSAGDIMRTAVQGALQALQQTGSDMPQSTPSAGQTPPPPPPAAPAAPASEADAMPPADAGVAPSSNAAESGSSGPQATTFPTPPSQGGAPRPRANATERSRRPAAGQRSPFDLTRAFGSGQGSGPLPPQGDDASAMPPPSPPPSTSQTQPPAGLGSLLPPPRRAARRGSGGDGPADGVSAPATPSGDTTRTPSRGSTRPARGAGASSGNGASSAAEAAVPVSLGGIMSSPAFHQFASQMLGSLSAGGPGRGGGGSGPEMSGGADLGSLVSMALGALGGGGTPGGTRAQQRRLVPEAPWREELPVEEAQAWEDTIQADTALLATLRERRQLSAAYAAFAGLDSAERTTR